MRRAITSFAVDEAGDPYAELDCGHRQHVRHRPPFTNRPWVLTEEGRRGKLGERLDCLRCDRFEWPDGLVWSRSTPAFDRDTVPAGLCRDHATARGTWARIVVEEGSLLYHVDGIDEPSLLTPAEPGIIVPERRHRVQTPHPVRFRVEFWKAG